MAGYFFDSSAIVKRYVTERGSTWVRSLTIPTAGNDLYLTRITGVEVVAALVGHVPPLAPAALAQVLADFEFDFQNQYQLVEVTAALIQDATNLVKRHRLRGYDAVQLATALQVRAGHLAGGIPLIVFVCADVRLNAAANTEGLVVDDPNQHP